MSEYVRKGKGVGSRQPAQDYSYAMAGGGGGFAG